MGEGSNPGPHNLMFRRTRRVSTAPPTLMDLTNTPLTDVDWTESAASSGFLNVFERDFDVYSRPGWTLQTVMVGMITRVRLAKQGHPWFIRQ